MKKTIAFMLFLSLLLASFTPLATSAAQTDTDDGVILEAEWKQGRLYDQPEDQVVDTPKRRYTVISGLKEGDILEFTYNESLWGGWGYPADEQGAIGTDVWFDITDGGTYTVAPINGRVPTKLRICVFSRPNYDDITEQMWTKFDMEIKRLNVTSNNIFKTGDWKLGSFREGNTPTASNDSKYMVLPCHEGEFFTFNVTTTDWNVYVIPADSQGALPDKSFTVNGVVEYVVEGTEDRMPSQLRITVTPKKSGNITDEVWNTFTASLYTKEGVYIDRIPDYNLFRTAEWQKGTFNGTEVVASDDARCTVIPCNFNDTFSFKFDGTDFGIRIDFYDKNGKIDAIETKTLTKNTSLRIEAEGGRIPSEIRVTAYLTAGGKITDSAWKKFNTSCTQESDFIRVATMNFGLWNDGATQSVADTDVPKVFEAWKKMLQENDVDILAGQEWVKFFDRSAKIPVDDYLFSQFYANIYNNSPKMFYSKIRLTENTNVLYQTCSGNGFSKAYAMINGKRVCLINAHASIETTFETNRKNQFLELIEEMNKEEYVILFGDFNAYTTSEFDLFTDAGYTLANCGEFGSFDTWPHFDLEHSWKNEAIDNIIVSSNIKLLDVQVDRRDLSDHSMLYADIQIIDEEYPVPTPGEDEPSDKPSDEDPADSNTDATNAGNTSKDSEEKSSIGLIIGLVAGGAVVLAGIAVAVILILKKKKKA